ncbi:MAG TPA: ferritin-like domain-containing protein [Acidimicrobiales bacterium]|nr:ferritin-like domain-containing protein [Acidimicrobiales bacterium]
MSQETAGAMETDIKLNEGAVTAALSRRQLLVGGAAASLALAAAACGGDDDTGTATGDDPKKVNPSRAALADLDIVQFAAGLEVLAVGTYKAALDAATANKLGPVPPAVAEFVKTAMNHHQEHLNALNGALKAGARDQVTQPNAKLKPTVDAQFANVKDAGGAANLALMLETIAADTYLAAIPKLESDDSKKLAASIQAVDQQHRAILLFALGQYPVPETFHNPDQAATP